MISAIIGFGKQGNKIAKILSKNNHHIKIYDPVIDKSNLKSLKNYEIVKNYNNLLNDSKIDNYFVLTPTNTHKTILKKLFKIDKKIFCEKPLVSNLKEFLELKKINYNPRIQVGYIYRYANLYKYLKKKINENKFGRVLYCNLKIYGKGGHKIWKHNKNTSGGVEMEMVSHMIDLSTWLFGKIKKAQRISSLQIKKERKIENQSLKVNSKDSSIIQLNFHNKVIVNIEANFFSSSFFQSVNVIGENGDFFGTLDGKIKVRECLNSNLRYKTITNHTMMEKQILSFLKKKEFNNNDASSFTDNYFITEVLDKLKN